MIQINNYSFYYKKKKPVLSNWNATLESGKVYGLFGINGCGKTTFLHALGGINFPKQGTILVGEEQPKSRKASFLKDIFFVPDAVELPKFSVSGYIKCYRGFYPSFSKDQLNEYLAAFDIKREEQLKEMSFGQQKKFHLAFAMACNPKVLLLDEPTNGLDIPSKEQFRKIMLRYIEDDKTVIISTHQARDLDQIIDHILLIHDQELLVNRGLLELSKKFKYQALQDIDDINAEGILYHKTSIKGIEVLSPNTKEEFSEIPIEFFVQTCFQKPDIIKKVLTA